MANKRTLEFCYCIHFLSMKNYLSLYNDVYMVDFFRFQGKCFELGTTGPCKANSENGIFGVNASTLLVECLKGADRLTLFQIPQKCPPGSARDHTNKCRELFK